MEAGTINGRRKSSIEGRKVGHNMGSSGGHKMLGMRIANGKI